MSRALREQVTAAILQLADTEAGQRLLDGIQIPKPVSADYAKDYAPLEKLKLERFVVTASD